MSLLLSLSFFLSCKVSTKLFFFFFLFLCLYLPCSECGGLCMAREYLLLFSLCLFLSLSLHEYRTLLGYYATTVPHNTRNKYQECRVWYGSIVGGSVVAVLSLYCLSSVVQYCFIFSHRLVVSLTSRVVRRFCVCHRERVVG